MEMFVKTAVDSGIAVVLIAYFGSELRALRREVTRLAFFIAQTIKPQQQQTSERGRSERAG